MISTRKVAYLAVLAFFFGMALGQLAFEYGYWSTQRENAADLRAQGISLEYRENVFANFWRAVLPMDEADS